MANGRNVNQFYTATIDANTGEILDFNSSSAKAVEFSNGINESNAKSKARQALEHLAPKYANEVALDDIQTQPMGSGYLFTFVRIVNGIPAPFDNITVGIDGNGQLDSYQLNWHDAQFPSANPVLSLSDAVNAFKKNPPSQLNYVPIPPAGPQPLAYTLAYTDNAMTSLPYFGVPIQQGLPWLDASTGQFLNADGSPQSATASSPAIPVASGGPDVWPTKRDQSLDATGSEQVARQALNLGNDWQLQNSNWQTGSFQPSKEWNLQFQNKGNITLDVGVDANFGIVTHVVRFSNPNNPGAASPDHLMAQSSLDSNAVSFMKSVLPNLAGAVYLVPIELPMPKSNQAALNYQVFAKANGVPVQLGSLTLSKVDGQVDNYFLTFNWSATLPDPSKAISAATAWENLAAHEPLRLEYVLPVDGVNSQGFANFSSSARLVYGLKTTGEIGFIDALSGKWLGYGEPASQQVTDIQGHYGEKEMNYLVSRGVLAVTDGKVTPDAIVTRGQFITMLSKLSNVSYGGPDMGQVFQDVSKSSPYYDAVEQALRQGWLPVSDKLNPDAPITRGQAAVWLINWLGWQEIAAKTELYQIPFSDAKSIPHSELGAAVIASEFGLIPPKNKAFDANGKMTVADVAVALAHATVVYDNE
jgi:hypothetical protein